MTLHAMSRLPARPLGAFAQLRRAHLLMTDAKTVFGVVSPRSLAIMNDPVAGPRASSARKVFGQLDATVFAMPHESAVPSGQKFRDEFAKRAPLVEQAPLKATWLNPNPRRPFEAPDFFIGPAGKNATPEAVQAARVRLGLLEKPAARTAQAKPAVTVAGTPMPTRRPTPSSTTQRVTPAAVRPFARVTRTSHATRGLGEGAPASPFAREAQLGEYPRLQRSPNEPPHLQPTEPLPVEPTQRGSRAQQGDSSAAVQQQG